eukprot:Amastigsp_a508876_287.p2 type:complete len:333 gc:universal Amastigsp_a508876_287:141-1139(+)
MESVLCVWLQILHFPRRRVTAPARLGFLAHDAHEAVRFDLHARAVHRRRRPLEAQRCRRAICEAEVGRRRGRLCVFCGIHHADVHGVGEPDDVADVEVRALALCDLDPALGREDLVVRDGAPLDERAQSRHVLDSVLALEIHFAMFARDLLLGVFHRQELFRVFRILGTLAPDRQRPELHQELGLLRAIGVDDLQKKLAVRHQNGQLHNLLHTDVLVTDADDVVVLEGLPLAFAVVPRHCRVANVNKRLAVVVREERPGLRAVVHNIVRALRVKADEAVLVVHVRALDDKIAALSDRDLLLRIIQDFREGPRCAPLVPRQRDAETSSSVSSH